MNTLIKSFLILVFTLFTTTSNAECTSVVRYINGVWNENIKASNNTTDVLYAALKIDSRICVESPLFNPSQSYLIDIAETFALKRVIEEGYWASFKNGLVSGVISGIGNVIAAFTGVNPLLENQKVLDDMYTSVKSDLDTGKGVILVAHSEGNLFALRLKQMANQDGYTDDLKFKIVHLAPPTFVTQELGRNVYIRSDKDGVISSLLFNKNTVNFVPTSDTSLGGHGMLSTYLNTEMTGNFTNFLCQSSLENTKELVINSVKRAATCQTGDPCVFIGFSSC